jgi:riboflavin synthase
MFTGIIEEVGRVGDLVRGGDAAQLTVHCRTVVEDVRVGDSIAVNGCCVTATEATVAGFTADLMAETLRATTLDDLADGAPVNLERAMRADDRFGGHLVQGHVDAVGELVAREQVPGAVLLTLTAPPEVARYLVDKGSITVDGASLTVVDVTADRGGTARFRVGLIPHTLEVTTFGAARVGDRVNLEADVVAKHVHHLLTGGAESPYTHPGLVDTEESA